MLDTAAYITTGHIGLVNVFETDEERTAGLSVDEIVVRLPADKKVNPQKLARCLRLLSVEHWWTEPAPGVFAPTRWALINTVGTPQWAWYDPTQGSLLGAIALTEHMIHPEKAFADDTGSSPWNMAWHKMGYTDQTWWAWLNREPERLANFALSMEGLGKSARILGHSMLHALTQLILMRCRVHQHRSSQGGLSLGVASAAFDLRRHRIRPRLFCPAHPQACLQTGADTQSGLSRLHGSPRSGEEVLG